METDPGPFNSILPEIRVIHTSTDTDLGIRFIQYRVLPDTLSHKKEIKFPF